MTFLVDAKKQHQDHQEQEEEDKEDEKDTRERREFLKGYIDQVMTDTETQPLSRFLHRHIREKATIDCMKKAEKKRNKQHNKVFYMSSSFIVDGMYPMVDGINKRKNIRWLRDSYFTQLPSVSAPLKWSANDANKSIVGCVFAPVKTSSKYEDNLQRLLLPAVFRLRETQKLNPRGAILAYMAMFASDHDPIVEIPLHKPTTLRGLVMNILDGSLYEGMSMSTLKDPFEISCVFEGDLKTFCDRLLRCSYYAVLLTLLGITAWVPERYPEDRFVTNPEGFVTIKMRLFEVIYDKGVWILNTKKRRLCFVQDFNSLLTYIYYPEEASATAINSP